MYTLNSIAKSARRIFASGLGLAVAIVTPALVALAQAPQDGAAVSLAPEKSYVYQYILVGLCLGLGIFLVGQASKRSDSIDKKDSLAYEDK